MRDQWNSPDPRQSTSSGTLLACLGGRTALDGRHPRATLPPGAASASARLAPGGTPGALSKSTNACGDKAREESDAPREDRIAEVEYTTSATPRARDRNRRRERTRRPAT